MKVQAYCAFQGTLQITVATQRAEPMASTRFTAATIHEDYAAQVRALLKEYRHVGATSLSYPATKRLSTYLPTHNGEQIFAIRELQPIGSPRDVDDQWQLEIMRIRYSFTLHLLPAAFLVNESVAEAMERHIEYAVRQLFLANGVPDVYIPGDQELRSGTGTEVDISCEMGPSSGRVGVEIPHPSQS